MKASLLFDLNDPQDKEDFGTAVKGEDWKEAFQSVWEFARNANKYQDHEAEYAKAIEDVKTAMLAIAEECEVSVW